HSMIFKVDFEKAYDSVRWDYMNDVLYFKISESEGLHKGYDRFEKVLSQLNQLQARPDNENCNMKFLRALPPSWSQVAITLKTKGG
ncbi:hypothetical protein Tco_1257288, partial [Tanacetum coccineum]